MPKDRVAKRSVRITKDDIRHAVDGILWEATTRGERIAVTDADLSVHVAWTEDAFIDSLARRFGLMARKAGGI